MAPGRGPGDHTPDVSSLPDRPRPSPLAPRSRAAASPEARPRRAVCPACGLAAGPGLRFCGGCGTDLLILGGEPAADARGAPGRAAAPDRPTSPSLVTASAPILPLHTVADRPRTDEQRPRRLPRMQRPSRPRAARPRAGGRMNGPALGTLVMGAFGTAGALMTWVTITANGSGSVTRTGVDMGMFGLLAFVAGVALALAGAARALHAGALALVQLVGLVASVALILTAAIELLAVDGATRDILGRQGGMIQVGVGLYLIVVAGVSGIVLAGFITSADA
jgi:hypothetical protein